MRIRTGRLAIRHGDVLLAVPPMHQHTPPYARQLIFEAVLRRQFGLAATLAEIERDIIEGRQAHVPGIGALIAQRPHSADQAAA